MSETRSDALVFFGATGDLAYKKIFPALQAMARRGHLNVPVIGVAKAGWNLEQLRARARDSVDKHGGVDRTAFDKLSGLLRYVDGDYSDFSTYEALRKELGGVAEAPVLVVVPPYRDSAGCSFESSWMNERPERRQTMCQQAQTMTTRSGSGTLRHPSSHAS